MDEPVAVHRPGQAHLQTGHVDVGGQQLQPRFQHHDPGARVGLLAPAPGLQQVRYIGLSTVNPGLLDKGPDLCYDRAMKRTIEVNLDEEVVEMLTRLAGSQRKRGDYLNRLIREQFAGQPVRERLDALAAEVERLRVQLALPGGPYHE